MAYPEGGARGLALYDLQNVLHVQLTGRKRLRMISPLRGIGPRFAPTS